MFDYDRRHGWSAQTDARIYPDWIKDRDNHCFRNDDPCTYRPLYYEEKTQENRLTHSKCQPVFDRYRGSKLGQKQSN